MLNCTARHKERVKTRRYYSALIRWSTILHCCCRKFTSLLADCVTHFLVPSCVVSQVVLSPSYFLSVKHLSATPGYVYTQVYPIITLLTAATMAHLIKHHLSIPWCIDQCCVYPSINYFLNCLSNGLFINGHLVHQCTSFCVQCHSK